MDYTIKVRLNTEFPSSKLESYGIVLSLPASETTLDEALQELNFASYEIEYLACELEEVLLSLEENYTEGCLYSLNYLAERIANLSEYEKNVCRAAIFHKECENRYLYLFELIQVLESLEEYTLLPDIFTEEEYSAYLTEVNCENDLCECCSECWFSGEIGRGFEDGQFTEYGYVYRKEHEILEESILEYAEIPHAITVSPHKRFTVSLFLFLE